jgi:FkbM family methyltransferase
VFKQLVSKFLRKKIFYKFWRKLYEVSLYGMNMGPASGYTHYSGEEWIINFVKSNIKRTCPIIFDVGANVGNYASAVIESFGRNNIILYCIEPSLKAFQMLRDNFQEYRNVKIYNLGLSDKAGTVKLYSNGKGEGAASIFIDHLHIGTNALHVEEVTLTTLDEFCYKNNMEKIDFLKMDVEGNELSVLKGAKRMLGAGAIDFIQFEFAFPNIAARVFFRDIYFCLEKNYSIYRSLVDGIIKIDSYNYKDEIFTTQNFLAISRGVEKTIIFNKIEFHH